MRGVRFEADHVWPYLGHRGLWECFRALLRPVCCHLRIRWEAHIGEATRRVVRIARHIIPTSSPSGGSIRLFGPHTCSAMACL